MTANVQEPKHNSRDGPGPGAYMLPPLVGYPHHDFTRWRNPAYTIKQRHGVIDKSKQGPGPDYDVSGLTQYGKEAPPAWSLRSRHKQAGEQGMDVGFGFPTYKEGPNPPAYSIRSRPKGLGSAYDSPGPQKYTLPPSIGCHIPDKVASPCFSMRYRTGIKGQDRSPGPAAYGYINPSKYKNAPPAYTIRPNVPPPKAIDQNPGPATYLPVIPECKHGITMGHRTDNRPYITPEDAVPCVNE